MANNRQFNSYRDNSLWLSEAGERGDLELSGEIKGPGLFLKLNNGSRVYSTSALNGGIREDLSYVANINLQAYSARVELQSASYEEELAAIVEAAGYDSNKTTALGTAAWMERACHSAFCDHNLLVECLVTGSIDRNAVRAGDDASYRELEFGRFEIFDKGSQAEPKQTYGGEKKLSEKRKNSRDQLSDRAAEKRPRQGTLNIIIKVNADLGPGELCKAAITACEAKTAVLEDLELPSLQSPGFATGSGTDGLIIISDTNAAKLSDAGTHSVLGALIAKSLQKALRRSLLLNSAAVTARQHNVLKMIERYGISPFRLYDQVKNELSAAEFEKALNILAHDGETLCKTHIYLHFLDLFRKGLLEWGEVLRQGLELVAVNLTADGRSAAGTKAAAAKAGAVSPESTCCAASAFARKSGDDISQLIACSAADFEGPVEIDDLLSLLVEILLSKIKKIAATL